MGFFTLRTVKTLGVEYCNCLYTRLFDRFINILIQMIKPRINIFIETSSLSDIIDLLFTIAHLDKKYAAIAVVVLLFYQSMQRAL